MRVRDNYIKNNSSNLAIYMSTYAFMQWQLEHYEVVEKHKGKDMNMGFYFRNRKRRCLDISLEP